MAHSIESMRENSEKESIIKAVQVQWVFGGIECETHESFQFVVEKRDQETLLPLIERWTKPGSTIISDCLAVSISRARGRSENEATFGAL